MKRECVHERGTEIKMRTLVKDNQRRSQKASRELLLRIPSKHSQKDTSPPPFSPGFVHFIALRPCTECKIVIVENISSNGLLFCFSMWNVLAKK